MESTNLNEANFLKGTCLSMCPHAEVQLRLKVGLGHKLEKRVVNGIRAEYASPQLMIKEFLRSSAGHKIEASDVRPIPVLLKTVKYLFTVVCSSEDVSWLEIYGFVNNRLRAVRQDIIVQGNHGEEVIQILSSSAKFYVYSHYSLCDSECSEFDSHLNLQQLHQVLLSVIPLIKERLLASELQVENLTNNLNKFSITDNNFSQSNCYCADLNSGKSVSAGFNICKFCKSPDTSDSENALEEELQDGSDCVEKEENLNVIKFSSYEEIISLFMLINIRKPEIMLHIFEIPRYLRNSALGNVIKVLKAYLNGNHLPLMRLAPILPPILAVTLVHHLNEIQREVLGAWSVAYNSPNLNFKTEDLKRLLLFPSEKSLIKACHYYGLETSDSGVKFIKGNFKWNVSVLPSEKAEWVEEKLKKFSISNLFLGQLVENS